MEEKFLPLLEGLAQKLGTTTEYIFDVMVKQARIDAYLILFGWVLFFTLVVALIRKRRKIDVVFSGDVSTLGILIIILMVSLVPGLVMLVAYTPAMLYGLFNPEVAAIKNILGALR